MSARRVWIVVGVMSLVAGVIGGMTVDRMQFEPRRAAILEQLETAIRAQHTTADAMTVKGRLPVQRP